LEIEHQTCPSCREPVFDEAILRFGGLIVESSGGFNFCLHNRTTGDIVYMDKADVRDTIAYMVKHFKGAD
jgi:hypothetical protein